MRSDANKRSDAQREEGREGGRQRFKETQPIFSGNIHYRRSRTNWKQLRTEGSMLEPPNDATSPSCRGIWMESWSRRPRRRWSQKPVALATCLNKTAGWRRREGERGGGGIQDKDGGGRVMGGDRQGIFITFRGASLKWGCKTGKVKTNIDKESKKPALETILLINVCTSFANNSLLWQIMCIYCPSFKVVLSKCIKLLLNNAVYHPLAGDVYINYVRNSWIMTGNDTMDAGRQTAPQTLNVSIICFLLIVSENTPTPSVCRWRAACSHHAVYAF